MPGRVVMNDIWFRRPGIASVFTPRVGIAQERSTSLAVMMMWMGDYIGIMTRWSASRSQKCPGGSSDIGAIYESGL